MYRYGLLSGPGPTRPIFDRGTDKRQHDRQIRNKRAPGRLRGTRRKTGGISRYLSSMLLARMPRTRAGWNKEKLAQRNKTSREPWPFKQKYYVQVTPCWVSLLGLLGLRGTQNPGKQSTCHREDPNPSPTPTPRNSTQRDSVGEENVTKRR